MTTRPVLSADDPRRQLLTGKQIRAALELLFSPEWGQEQRPQGAADDSAAILVGEQNDNGAVSDDIGP